MSSLSVTAEELKELLNSKGKRHKYGAKPVYDEEGKLLAASTSEYTRHGELKLLEMAGSISDLKTQVEYKFIFAGVLITTYRADFQYIESGVLVVEDRKGVLTPEYRIKKKMMLAFYGIKIRETKAKGKPCRRK